MDLRKYLDWIRSFFRGNLQRLYLDSYDYNYQKNAYNDAVSFAKQNIKINGVGDLLERLQNDYQEYVEQRRCLKDEEFQSESDKYASWEKMHRMKVISVLVFITCFVLAVISIQQNRGVWAVIAILSMLLAFIAPIAAVILQLIEMINKKKYVSYAENVKGRIKVINYSYLSKVDQIYNQIDDLYLASLEPAHREMVLMRRDQERQHQELIRLQKEQQKMQKKILDEQSKSRIAQEGLLDIEREREERYWKNRY